MAIGIPSGLTTRLNSSTSCSEPAEKDPSLSNCAAWFAAPPLIPGEDEASYFGVGERILAVAPPKDFIEALLAWDVINLTWEIFRLRRLKAGTLRISARGRLRRNPKTFESVGTALRQQKQPRRTKKLEHLFWDSP
jgi:hypothetical protein